MKNTLFSVLAIVCMAFCFYSCENKTDPELALTSSNEVTLDDGTAGQTTVITFSTNRYWLVKASESWAHVDPYSGTDSQQFNSVTVTFDKNPTNDPRSVVVTIHAGGLSESVTITQPGVFTEVTSVVLSQSNVEMVVGETLQLTATVYPKKATDPTVTWSATTASGSTENVPVTVSSTGLVEAVGTGYAYIMATSGDYYASCIIYVFPSEPTDIYVYNALGWENTLLYAWDYGGSAYTDYPGMEPAGTVDIGGWQFYKYSLNSKWFDDYFCLRFNDGQSAVCLGWNEAWVPGDSYYFVITGPFDEDGYSMLAKIEDLSNFDPLDYYSGDEAPEGSLFYENFEDKESWTASWTLIDADGDEYCWMAASDALGTGLGHNNTQDMLVSQSYTRSAALNPDNWAFTPAITLASTANYLKFWLSLQSTYYPAEHYAVYITEQIPTSGDIASACTLLTEGDVTGTPSWEKHYFRLPEEFDGKTVHIGFRHFNSSDGSYLQLDEVLVTTVPPAN